MRKKTPEQVDAIRDVQRATERAMGEVISYLSKESRPRSEEAHGIIDQVLEEHGCESPEGHIVAGGKQSTEPHEIGSGHLERGTSIVIDIYPRSKTSGYFADMSRTVCIGPSSTKLQKMYDTVLEAQTVAISMIKPGVRCGDVQAAIEDLFTKAGYLTSGKGREFPFAEGFVHGLGHGVGLNVHEEPRVGRGSIDVLEEGDVITIEPGLYYKGIGGMRLEDMILITAHGPENLTNFPKMFEI